MKKRAEKRKKTAEKRTPKPGRPQKSLTELAVTGGYDRNPGRLLKRLGIKQAAPAEDLELAKRWDEFYELDMKMRKKDRAYGEACKLDADGKHGEADKVLLAAGIAPEIVEQRRAHLNYMERTTK